jgi:hypothetical protein
MRIMAVKFAILPKEAAQLQSLPMTSGIGPLCG